MVGRKQAHAPSFIAAACPHPGPSLRATRPRAPSSSSCRRACVRGARPTRVAPRRWRPPSGAGDGRALALLGPPGERRSPCAAPPRTPAVASATFASRCFRRAFMPARPRCCANATGGGCLRRTNWRAGPTCARRTRCASTRRSAPRALRFPTREQALAEVGRAVRDVLARGGAPVVVVDPLAIAARHRRRAGRRSHRPRAHRSIVQAAIALPGAGAHSAPGAATFAAEARPGRCAPLPLRRAYRRGGRGRANQGSSWCRRMRACAAMAARWRGLRARVMFPHAADLAGLHPLRRGERATEVALVNAPSDPLAGALRGARNRRLRARTSASDRAFRRLSWPARRGFAAPSGAMVCVKFPAMFNLGMGEITVILLLILSLLAPRSSRTWRPAWAAPSGRSARRPPT